MKAKILVNLFVFRVQEPEASNLTLAVIGMLQEHKAGGLSGASMSKIFLVCKIS